MPCRMSRMMRMMMIKIMVGMRRLLSVDYVNSDENGVDDI